MTLHFYDVGQAMSVLVELPDGRHVLVDTADDPHREGCADVCARAQAHLLERLRDDLHGAPLDMLWITHQHSDHIGGAPEVLASVPVTLYVDNGRDERKAEVRRARDAATARGAQVRVVDPRAPRSPAARLAERGAAARGAARWPRSCREDENECSIALRIDYCRSSVLLTGDAEHEEEKLLDPGGPVTLLQVGHHGSDTSSSPALLARVRPVYAVISAGKPDEGLNHEYCHPRASIVQRLSQVLDADAANAGAVDAGPAPGPEARDAHGFRWDALRSCDAGRLDFGALERAVVGDGAGWRRGARDDGGRGVPEGGAVISPSPRARSRARPAACPRAARSEQGA